MLLSEVDIGQKMQKYLQGKGIEALNPPQEMAVKAGILEENNVIVASPTASGKTLIAELAILKNCSRGRKAVYISPLRALANEKYEDFDYKGLGLTTAISTGDLDSNDSWLSRYDVIIVTAEKMDSLMRHSPEWLSEIGLVVIDEIHLLNDQTRGPTLEIVITKLKDMGCQILGLSATISNADELAEWLDAKLVSSEYRPVKLHEGVFDGTQVEFSEKNGYTISGDLIDLVTDTIKKEKQCIVFSSTRRSAESNAQKISKALSLKNSDTEKVNQDILGALSRPTEQCKKLGGCVSGGVAFHHAGLVNEQRKIVEDAFKQDKLKVIVATPTLAAGVNLPAFRVIITSMTRYYQGYGSSYIPVLEYKQMAGRAGRPKYDSEGEAIIVSNDIESMMERYVLGREEDIRSKLSAEPVLRTHILSLISTETVKDQTTLMDFLSETFFAFQYGDMYRLEERVTRVIERLDEQGFIKGDIGLAPTLLGRRVSQLYIDPETAYIFINSMKERPATDFGLLSLVSSCREMGYINVGKRETDSFEQMYLEREDELMYNPDPGSIDYDYFIPSLKTAAVLESWINENGEDVIVDNFSITPGLLRGKINVADWLLYSCQELAVLSKLKCANDIRKIRTRVINGIKEELLPLIRIKGVGRVRARRLYSAGFTTLSAIKKAPLPRLESLIGKETAKSVKTQVGGSDNQTL